MTDGFLWQAEDVVVATRGRCLHEQSWRARAVSTDSRAVVSGDLFVALKGAAGDGHDHVAAAFAAGAVAALVERQPLQAPPNAPLVFVDDTVQALCDLGRVARARTRAQIIVVTGSVGKTTTVDMVKLSLGAVGNAFSFSAKGVAGEGLPLALANVPPDADYAVFEAAALRQGELGALAGIASPDIVVVTPLGEAGLDSFSSLDDAAEAQAELFKGVGKRGVVILDRSGPSYRRFVSAAKKSGVKKILSFSSTGKADAFARGVSLSEVCSAVSAVVGGRTFSYAIGAPGDHLVQDSLAALLAAFVASGKREECAAALSHYASPCGRGAVREIFLADGGVVKLFDGSADAVPASVRAALRLLGRILPAGEGRRILVLGDMAGLGPLSPELHMALGADIGAAGIDLVFCCGDMTRYLYDTLPVSMRGAYAVDSQELASFVSYTLRSGDVVAVKGGEAMEMGVVVEEMKVLDIVSEQKIVNG